MWIWVDVMSFIYPSWRVLLICVCELRILLDAFLFDDETRFFIWLFHWYPLISLSIIKSVSPYLVETRF